MVEEEGTAQQAPRAEAGEVVQHSEAEVEAVVREVKTSGAVDHSVEVEVALVALPEVEAALLPLTFLLPTPQHVSTTDFQVPTNS